MIVKKCDICGAEMRTTTPRYKVTFDGWLYTKEKDICIDCFKRIADEIRQADTPQTDCKTCEHWKERKDVAVKDCERLLTNQPCEYEPDCQWK